MSHDTLILFCPKCQEQFPVAVYSGSCSDLFYGIENVPLKILAEVNDASKKGQIQCIQCGQSIAVQVLYITHIRALNECQREGWKIT